MRPTSRFPLIGQVAWEYICACCLSLGRPALAEVPDSAMIVICSLINVSYIFDLLFLVPCHRTGQYRANQPGDVVSLNFEWDLSHLR